MDENPARRTPEEWKWLVFVSAWKNSLVFVGKEVEKAPPWG